MSKTTVGCWPYKGICIHKMTIEVRLQKALDGLICGRPSRVFVQLLTHLRSFVHTHVGMYVQ